MSHHLYDWKPVFLAALADVPVVSQAAKACGISYRHAYKTRELDAEFAQAWDDALEEGIDKAEQEAFRRAVTGFEEPVVYQGQLTPVWSRDAHGELLYEEFDTGEVYPPKHERAGEPIKGTRPVQARDANGQPMWLTIRKHSDPLLALFLKGRRKRVYSDRTEITGADGGPVQQVDETAKAARVAQLLAIAQQRKEFEDLA